jgi:PAS domain S-box-containing protein
MGKKTIQAISIKSHELCGLLFKNNTDAILLMTYDGKINYANPAAQKIFNITEKQLIKRGKKAIIDSSNHDLEDVLKILSKKGKYSGKFTFKKKGRENFYGKVSAIRFKDIFGNEMVSMTIRDLTANKRIKEKLKFSHKLVINTLESMTDAFVSLDKNWRYTYMNKRAGEIFNRDPAKMIGKHIWTEFPEGIGQPFHLAYEKAFKEQKFIQLEEYYPPYDKWFENRIFPSKEGISIFFSDVTERKKNEEKLTNANRVLKERENQLNLFVKHSPAAVAMFDKDMKYLVVSHAWVTNYKLREEDIIGRCHYEIFPEIPERWKEIHRRCMAGAIEKCEEDPFPRADGSIDWVRWEIRPWLDKNGSIGGIMILSEVITERKKNEAALLENKIRLEAAIKASNTGLWDWDLKTNRVFYSREWKEMIGYKEWEISDDLSEWESRVHPDDLKEVLERTHSFIKNPWANYEVEFRFRHKDGSYRWILSKASLIRDEEGNPVRMLGSHLDITNRKKVEEEVLAERNFSNVLLESLPGIFYFYDDKGKFIKCNKDFETVSGYSFKEIAEMNPLDFFIKEEKEYMQKCIRLVFETGESDAEAKFVSKDGKLTPYYFTGKRIEMNGIPCLIGMGIDITKRKNAEENLHILMNRLVEAEEIMRKTAAQQLHDQVGQNLTALTINLNYVMSHLLDDSKVKIENRLNDSLVILNETIEQIRNIMVELRPSVLDDYGLNAALKWSINKFAERTKTTIDYKGIELSKRLPLNIEYTLFRTVQEALHNVAKHAEAKKVIISLEEENNIVKLKVEDDGIGFDINRIKEYKNPSGLGLLSMAERIYFIGGKLEISSEPGKGTSVIINIKR